MSLQALSQAVVCLRACLKHKERSAVLMVTLPPETWFALYYEASKAAVANSEQSGNGGIVAMYQPPEGENWSTGFWFSGAWVRKGKA